MYNKSVFVSFSISAPVYITHFGSYVQPTLAELYLREAAKNNGLFLVARPLRGGWGKGLATKKNNSFEALKKFPQKCGY